MTKMTYSALLDYLIRPLAILSLGGKRSFTAVAVGNFVTIKNSMGSIYRISANDWCVAKRIRAVYSKNPWRIEHYCILHDSSSYSLGYAAALLRHIEEVELDLAMAEFMSGFPVASTEQHAA